MALMYYVVDPGSVIFRRANNHLAKPYNLTVYIFVVTETWCICHFLNFPLDKIRDIHYT